MSAAGLAGASGTPDADAAGAIAGWLGLAAMPTFAVMALATGILDASSIDPMCMAVAHGWPGGMALMYVLMSAFHASPWLKLLARRRRRAGART